MLFGLVGDETVKDLIIQILITKLYYVHVFGVYRKYRLLY